MNKYINTLTRLVKTYILRDKFLLSARQWFSDKGDDTLRINYDLSGGSIVFDVGGYEGSFSEKIHDKYKSTIYIFEPVNSFYDQICHKFKGVENIYAHNFGLSSQDQKLEISLNGDASSTHLSDGEKERIELRSITDFIQENNIEYIDLMKINIEGGEFDILPVLIENNIISSINNLQIQFHLFVENAEEKRDEIRKRLSRTHELTYDYYFIWENWKLKV